MRMNHSPEEQSAIRPHLELWSSRGPKEWMIDHRRNERTGVVPEAGAA